MERWNEYTRRLDTPTHSRLLIELGAGLMQARKAAEIPGSDGQVSSARGHLRLAIGHLLDALKILETPQ